MGRNRESAFGVDRFSVAVKIEPARTKTEGSKLGRMFFE